ncbi:MAG TPA: hypothetical protein VFY17_01345 [Pilimelia sp.]|nr:hypothetical protein [Pilimelia sp.]
MPVVSVAVCPHPPLLIPEVAAGAAAELTAVREACAAAVAPLRDADVVVAVGGGDRTGWWPAEGRPTLAPYGLEPPLAYARVASPPQPSLPAGPLPLSLTVGAWLAGPAAPPLYAASVRADASGAAALAAQVAAVPARVGLLVLGDGSACRGEKAPGYADPRAEPYDRHVAALLAAADRAGLAALDPGLSSALHVAGYAPWQVLAAAAGGEWAATLLHHEAPYGVAYLVASWRPA